MMDDGGNPSQWMVLYENTCFKVSEVSYSCIWLRSGDLESDCLSSNLASVPISFADLGMLHFYASRNGYDNSIYCIELMNLFFVKNSEQCLAHCKDHRGTNHNHLLRFDFKLKVSYYFLMDTAFYI